MMKMSMVTTITTGIMIMIDNFSKMLCFDKNLYMLSSLTKLRTNSIIKTIMFIVQILYHIVTIYIGVSVIQSAMSSKLKICGWNMQGSNSSLPYVKQLLYKCDILCVSEHWLYKCDQHRLDINSDFHVHAKSSNDLDENCYGKYRGFGGVAIYWNSKLSASPINIDNDRICGIQIHLPDHATIHVLSVYLPSKGNKYSDFGCYLDMLNEIYCLLEHSGPVIICGDFNADTRPKGPKGKISDHGQLFKKLLDSHGLISLTDHEKCTGPQYTFHAENIGTSLIDHIVVKESYLQSIKSIKIIEDDLANTSYHLPIYVEIQCDWTRLQTKDLGSPVLAWNKLSNEQIKELYTEMTSGSISILKKSLECIVKENLDSPHQCS